MLLILRLICLAVKCLTSFLILTGWGSLRYCKLTLGDITINHV